MTQTAAKPALETIIDTDNRSRAVLPGHPNQRFILEENDDGVIRLIPAIVMSTLQYKYDHDPEMQALLEKAMSSPTVYHKFKRRTV